MKLDYDFIKKILLTMEEYEEHSIRAHILMKKLNINSKTGKDKFIGHILILGDNGAIDCDYAEHKYGLVYFINGNYDILNVNYRLTAKGYEFLEILKNDTAFNKVKDFALNTALDIGKQIIVKLATGGM